jgi:transposase
MSATEEASSKEETAIKYVCGIDIGSQSCSGCVIRPDKSVVVEPIAFTNAREGWQVWEEKLSQLDATPNQILIGLEAASRYGEKLYHELEQRGYLLRLVHLRKAHPVHELQELRTKTDRLDAMTIASVLLSGEAWIGYVPKERVAIYQELVRLHNQLSDETAKYQNEIHALVGILFPEFTQVFADPCSPSALRVLRAYPSASEIAAAGEEAIVQVLGTPTQPTTDYGRPAAKKLVKLARRTASSGRSFAGRSVSLRILCDQLEHTKANLARLQAEMEQLPTDDPQVEGLKQIPAFGSKTSAILPVELENVQRFAHTDDAIATGGIDVEINEHGTKQHMLISKITVDPERADLFGTTRLEHKLWVDYIFDWFGATLERRFRRYFVGMGFATLVWGLGFIMSSTIGFANDYLHTPAVYYFWIGIAWCTNALRWLSQVYHIRTNAVRPCFPLDDATYKSIVSPFASNAVRNKRIFLRGTLVSIPVLGYFGAITLGYIKPLSSLALGFPSSFPIYWLTGNYSLIKLAIISLFLWVAYVEVQTGAQLTLSTAPLYAKLATLPVLPLPSLVTELFRGVLNLYLTGAVMWSFGIVLVELLYKSRADALGIGFLIVVIGLGIFAYLAPLQAVRRIWQNAKSRAIGATIFDFYASNTPHDSNELKGIDEYIQSLGGSEPGKFSIVQLISFVAGQLLPVLPLLANTFLSGFSLIEKISGR